MDPAIPTRSASSSAFSSAPATAQPNAELDTVRVLRTELREALSTLEHALAAPAPGRALAWGEAVHTALGEIADDFGEHIEVTEGPGGLYPAILAADLRLANAVDSLTAEHARIAEEIAALFADTTAPVTQRDVSDVRDRATRLIAHLIRHRQRGADLIYEAYETDIGGGD